MLVCKTETWMEHRGGFTYSIEKGCVSMNNAQKIRSMTDEELAEFLFQVGYNHRWGLKEYALDWLQQPAVEEDKHENYRR